MKRIMAVATATLTLTLLACEPTPTITAVPSTLRPACREITTVTGQTTPPQASWNLVLEQQNPATREWVPFRWFPTGASGEGRQEIRGKTKADGSYVLTYAQPQTNTATIRLRVRAMKKALDEGVWSTSFYVTPPKGC